MKQPFLRERIAGVIGNLLEHYDHALFGLLAPFIAPLFFNKEDPVVALILTYAILPLGFLTRPLGSLFFGRMGDRLGRKKALFYSLLGMATVTMLIGCVPLYQDIGIWAPVCLALGKMLQSFFAAGETTGGAIFVLEQTSRSQRGLTSSIYDASTVAGILIASAVVTLMSRQGSVEHHWRILFWAGSLTAIGGVFLRWSFKQDVEPLKVAQVKVFAVLKEHRADLLRIILASGFAYTTYALPFTLMNGYVPLVTSCSKSEVMSVNTLLLVVDMCLLPFFGFLANRFGKEKVMVLGALCSALGALPLFGLLGSASLGVVIAVRFAIVLCGVAFAAPFYAWAIEQVPFTHRYLIVALGYTLGSQLIGVPASAICLWLYQATKWVASPGLYLMVVGTGASLMVYHTRRNPILVNESSK